MPVKYAIRSKRATPLTQAEELRLKNLGSTPNELSYEYEEVPLIVADMNKENGVYAAFSENGVKISDWLLFTRDEKVEAAYQAARKRHSPVLQDSICQDIQPGDYVMAHDHSHRNLELSKIIRNMKVNTVVEDLSGCYNWQGFLRTRNPDVYIRIPQEMIEGGEVSKKIWTKKFAVKEHNRREQNFRPTFNVVDEDTALAHNSGYFAYFDERGNNITGWISLLVLAHNELILDKTFHSKKKIVPELDTPLTDAMGTDLLLGDWVFSDDNHFNNFILGKVIGFSKDRVRLCAYSKSRFRNSETGERIITLNWPKNMIKLPIEIVE